MIFSDNFRKMAHNDLLYMTFWRPGKGNAQHFQGRQNVAEKNRTKALCAVCGFSEPEPP
jgi:hypothetical protein